MTKARLIPAMFLFLAGCGLVNELKDFKGINFQLPVRKYSVSTDDPQWHAPPETFTSIPPISCGSGGVVADCCNPPPPFPNFGCDKVPLACDGGVCSLKFAYEQVQAVDLAKEVPSLSSSGGQIFSSMTLTTIDLTVDENSLNVTLPPVDIYLAPASANTASDPGAKKIGTMSSKAAGFTGPDTIKLDDAAQKLFSMFANDFRTPFNIIISTNVVYRSGGPVPKGKISFSVGGKVAAKF
jgi:hypothetical protein